MTDPLDRLREEIHRVGRATDFAKENGFSDAYISLVLNRRKPPSKRLLALLGLERRVTIDYIERPSTLTAPPQP